MELTIERFTPAIGSEFEVVLTSGPAVSLQLSKVDRYSLQPHDGRHNAPEGVRAEPFTLLFKSVKSGFLPQGTYILRHAELGEFHLFLKAYNEDKDFYYYDAPVV